MSLNPVPVPVRELLAYRSGEAFLVCARGHIAGHPLCCVDGCIPLQCRGIVADTVAYKTAPPFSDAPVQVEQGWLIDGHHRVARAWRDGVETLQVVTVAGVLAHQQRWHARIRAQVFQDFSA